MNASNTVPLIGAVGNALPAVPDRAPGSPEGAFADSLSAALSGVLPLPIQPDLNLPSPDLALLPVTLAKGNAVAGGAGDLETLLPGGAPNLLPPVLEGDFGGNSDLSAPLASSLNLLAGQKPSTLPASTPEIAKNPVLEGGPVIAQDPKNPIISPASLLVSSSLPNEPSQPTVVKSGNDTSTTAMAASVLNRGQTDQALPQRSQSRTNGTDKASAVPVTGGLVSSLDRGTLTEFTKPVIRQGSLPPSDQGSRPSTPPPSFVQQAGEPTDRALTNAAHLAEMRAKTAQAQAAGDSLAPTKPVNGVIGIAAVPNAKAAEAALNEFQPGAERIDILGRELGSSDPLVTTGAKPSVQAAQPPTTQIALQIARAIPQGIDRFSIQLHPAELGSVEIQLDFSEEGRVSALITAERPETLDMLQRDGRALERSLNGTGLQLDSGGLSFSLKQEQNQQGQGFNAPSHQQSRAFEGDRGQGGGGDGPLDQEPVRIGQQRLLDIRT